jgi:hypothetical protein
MAADEDGVVPAKERAGDYPGLDSGEQPACRWGCQGCFTRGHQDMQRKPTQQWPTLGHKTATRVA